MRYAALLLLLLLPTSPPIKGAGSVRLSAAGDTITGTWVYKSPGLFATDTAALTWSQKALGASSWTSLGTTKSRGTAASKVIPAVTTGASVRLCIVVNRVGTTPSPTACAQKGRAPAPSAGVDSLSLSLFITDGNLSYTRPGFFNVAVYNGTLADCDMTGGTIDALGRQVTGCYLTTGGAAYVAVQCLVAERWSKGVLQFASWAFPSNTVSDCLTKAAPLAAGKYGAKWRPTMAPLDSVAFQQRPMVRDDSVHYRIRALASLR